MEKPEKLIVVSNRLPFVLKFNETSGRLERKSRCVYFVILLLLLNNVNDNVYYNVIIQIRLY